MEQFFLLFSDSFFSNLAPSISKEVIFYTVKAFYNQHQFLIVIVATTAFALASICNYILGVTIFKIVQPINNNNQLANKRINKLSQSKLLPIILFASCVPSVGKFVILFSGFCKVGLRKTLIYSSIAKLLFYSYMMFL